MLSGTHLVFQALKDLRKNLCSGAATLSFPNALNYRWAMDITDEKALLRKQAFAARKHAYEEGTRLNGESVLELARPHALIAGYMPIRTEIDPLPVMRELVQSGKTIGVPVIIGQAMPLEFHQWTPDGEMIAGQFGAMTPKHSQPIEPEMILAPLVGFDGFGNRLGYGGGFYDRSIAKIRQKTPCPLIGLAYSAQELEAIPTEPTDIALDAVITENGIRFF